MKREREILGRMLRRARQKRGLSQCKLRDVSGVSQPRISRIEAGSQNMEVDTLLRLVLALQLPWQRMLHVGGSDA